MVKMLKKRHDPIQPALPKEQLNKLLFEADEPETKRVTEYVEWQCRGKEKVLHAEKVATDRVHGRDYAVWDVHTDKERWWVVTEPANLYSQTLMPSLDYVLSFHIGLMMRVESRRGPKGSGAQQELLQVTTRKQWQAAEALDDANETEDFQAVGMLCREALLSLTRELANTSTFDKSKGLPKGADFPAWNDQFANLVAPGSSAEYVRGYLKTTGERAWRLAHWVTHAANATRDDARLAFEAVTHVIQNYAYAFLKLEADAPLQCGRCKSFKIEVEWKPELGKTGMYVAHCLSCGAHKQPSKEHPRAPKKPKAKKITKTKLRRLPKR